MHIVFNYAIYIVFIIHFYKHDDLHLVLSLELSGIGSVFKSTYM